MVRSRYEWDPEKDRENRNKHGVAFREAQALLERGGGVLELYDAEHSSTEDRFFAIGPTKSGLIVVVFTEREDDVIRIVSARKATSDEQELYREHVGSEGT